MSRPTWNLLLAVMMAACGPSVGQEPPAPSPEARRALASHQGTWAVVAFRREGEDAPEEIAQSIRRVVEGDHVVWSRSGKRFAGTTIVLDPTTDPPAIDVIPDGGPQFRKRVLGIYRQDGERLTICMADPDRPRPSTFAAEPGSRQTLMTFRRLSPEEAAAEAKPRRRRSIDGEDPAVNPSGRSRRSGNRAP